MAKRYYGWQKSTRELPDKHKYTALPLPDVIDLSQYKPVVVDQLKVNRCTGCAIGGALSGKMSELNLNPGNRFYWSPDDLYNGARILESKLTLDSGAQPVDVYKWIQQHGVIPYVDMPLTPQLSIVNPETLARDAIKLPYFTPVQIDTNPKNVVAHILDAMVAGHFVAQGAVFFLEWEDYIGGVLPLQQVIDPIAGYHETFYYKANTVSKVFYLQNSWGTEWGDGGLYEMPFEQVPILATMGMDLHYATFTAPRILAPQPQAPQQYVAPIREFAPVVQKVTTSPPVPDYYPLGRPRRVSTSPAVVKYFPMGRPSRVTTTAAVPTYFPVGRVDTTSPEPTEMKISPAVRFDYLDKIE